MDGKHTLWFSWGGSAGHQGLKMLEADTGTYQSGLTWTTNLISTGEWNSRMESEAKRIKEEEFAASSLEILEFIKQNPGCNRKMIVDNFECGQSSCIKKTEYLTEQKLIYSERDNPDNARSQIRFYPVEI